MPASFRLTEKSSVFATLIVVLTLTLASFPLGYVTANEVRLYVGHRARLSADIPAEWTVPPDGSADYSGNDGFVFSVMVPGDDFWSACEHLADIGVVAASAWESTTWNGNEACQIEGEFRGQSAVGTVLERPKAMDAFGETSTFVAILTDPDHVSSILDTLSFDSLDVSPQDYVYSVLDILEARAWYAPEIDWDRFRTDDLRFIANAQTYEETHWVIRDALNSLSAWGDNHSFFVPDGAGFNAPESLGTGMVLDGRTVMLVYPDSSAGRASIRVGDTIETVDGVPYNSGAAWIEELIGAGSVVTISRPGMTEPITVQMESGPYSRYVPPIVESITPSIGYIELFGTLGSDPLEYVMDAQSGVSGVAESATCGWVVDLRRNGGGSYSPMVMSVVSLMGDGHLVSFERRDGEVVERVELRNGRIYSGDVDVTSYLEETQLSEGHAPLPPVAVLIGPGTGSAAEVTAVAFIGRPDTRLFGETSAGATIGNTGYSLFDGSRLGLAEATYADRTGGTHIGGIQPDVPVAIEWEAYGTLDDPVVAAAAQWLSRFPQCVSSTPTE